MYIMCCGGVVICGSDELGCVGSQLLKLLFVEPVLRDCDESVLLVTAVRLVVTLFALDFRGRFFFFPDELGNLRLATDA